MRYTYTEEFKQKIRDEFTEIINDYHRKFNSYDMSRDYYRAHSRYKNAFNHYYKTYPEFKGSFGLPIEEEKKKIRRVDYDIVKENKKYKTRYIVSSVIEGSSYNKPFLESLKLYCKKNNAKLVLLWSRGLKVKDSFDENMYNELLPYIATQMKFNSKLSAVDFMLYPTQVFPLTGLSRFGAKDSSLIVASPKQHMETIPSTAGRVPHLLWSTGTISVPNYPKTRAGSLASQDNVLGALVIEVEDIKNFYIRPVQFINNGFVDLGIKYTPTEAKKVKTVAMVWGDLHLGEESDLAVKCAIKQAKYLKAENIVLHDVVSLNSINHHNKTNFMSKALVYEQFSTLEEELTYATNKLKRITDSFRTNIPKFYIVHSNHDNFLRKFLEDGEFIKNTPNAIYAAQLFIDMCQGKNPLERIGNKHTTFLPEDATMLLEGINIGLHGHNGVSGARGNTSTYFRNIDKCIIGHQHRPNIKGGCYVVGTLSELKLPYTKGLSAWLHANAVIYEGGYRQLITYISNRWKM